MYCREYATKRSQTGLRQNGLIVVRRPQQSVRVHDHPLDEIQLLEPCLCQRTQVHSRHALADLLLHALREFCGVVVTWIDACVAGVSLIHVLAHGAFDDGVHGDVRGARDGRDCHIFHAL